MSKKKKKRRKKKGMNLCEKNFPQLTYPWLAPIKVCDWLPPMRPGLQSTQCSRKINGCVTNKTSTKARHGAMANAKQLRVRVEQQPKLLTTTGNAIQS